VLARTVHPLLKTRGVPGTHDVPLLLEVLAALQREGIVSMPRFDKAKDDRLPREQWERVPAPVKVIILEGWCVGAIPQPEGSLEAPVNELERREDPDGAWRRYVNRALGSDYRPVFNQIKLLILLAAPGFEVVYRWRLQQEEELRRAVLARGGDVSQVMDERALERFISHYERLTRYILEEMPQRADIVVRMDHERRMTVELRSW
jgi:D-glycerate 3-kinase